MPVDGIVRRASIAIAVLCIASVAVTMLLLAVPSLRSALLGSANNGPAYSVGQTVDIPTSLFGDSLRTLIIFARSSCGGCQRAKPFYQGLIGALPEENGRQILMIATGAVKDDDEAYGMDLGIGRDRVRRLSVAVRLANVPTLLVVDSNGVVLVAHEGAPDSTESEQALRDAVLRVW